MIAKVGLANKHDIDGYHDTPPPGEAFATYSLVPMSKMSYLAKEIVKMGAIAEAAQTCCLRAGFPIRISFRDNKYICIVEQSWVTVEHAILNRAIIEACVITLEGAQQ